MITRREFFPQYHEAPIRREFSTQCSGNALSRREDGAQRIHVPSGERCFVQGGSVHIGPEDDTCSCTAWIDPEVGAHACGV
jgi:hypothetical protein